jgi:hypothetical protein
VTRGAREGPRGRLLGVEHEYTVVATDGPRLDMRSLIDELPLDGMRLDPGDAHAVRGLHGGVTTADGWEAEIATPPVACGHGALAQLDEHCAAALADLVSALGPDRRLTGYSTHLNVACPERRCRHTAERLARRWSPALSLLTLHGGSPGLLVRPRWRRLELGCEYLPTDDWQPALAFAAAAVVTAQRRADRSLPSLRVALEPSVQRFGWYVDRHAFGADLLQEGRGCRVRTASGSTLTAQEHLLHAWDLARGAAAAAFEPEVIERLDALVAGELLLPCEREPVTGVTITHDNCHQARRLPLTYSVDGHVVRPVALTWRTGVFELVGHGRQRWITVDGTRVRHFYEALHDGRLDHDIVTGRGRLTF